MTRPGRRAPPRKPKSAWLAVNGAPTPSARETRILSVAAYVLIAVFAAATIGMIAGPHRIGDYFTESDFYGAYADGARLIQQGRLLPSRYGVVGPGYETALALAGLVVRDLFLAAELLSLLASVAIVVLWFHLLRVRVNARLGAAAALFLVTNVFFYRYAFSATTDAFANALQSATLFALLAGGGTAGLDTGAAGRNRKPAGPGDARFALAGVLAALAFLTRYNAIYLVPLGLVAILAGGASTPRRGRAALAFAAGFLALVVPWILYSLAHGGTLSLQLHHNIAYEVFARSKGVAWDDYQKNMQSQFPDLRSVIARDPGAVASRMIANMGSHLRDDGTKLLGGPVVAAAVAGAVLVVASGWLVPLWPLLLAGALLFGTLVPVFYSERYSLALLPVYAMLAGAALSTPIAALAVGRRRLWLKALAAPALVALILPAAIGKVRYMLTQLPVEALEVAQTLRRLHAPGDKIIARKAHIGYYGGCPTLPFPFADSLAQLGRAAHEMGARWMYFSWPEAETRPAFWYLLDTSGVVPGLTARHVSSPRPAVLYEIGPEFGRPPAWFSNDTLFTWHTLRGRTLVDQTDVKLYEQYGWLSWWLGRLPESRDALKHAAVLAPNRAEVFIALGRTLVQLGDHEGARDAFARAFSLAPTNPDARLGLGLAAFLTGRDREAAEAWRPVIDVAPDRRILRAMAQLYDSLGDPSAAAQARSRLASLGS